MATPWIQMDLKFLEAASKELAAEAEISRHEAIGLMSDVWSFCRARAVTGDITGDKAGRKLEEAAGWRGEVGKLVAAAIAAGLVERTETGLRVKGMDRYAKLQAKAQKDKERLAAEREKQKCSGDVAATSRLQSGDVAGTSQGQDTRNKIQETKYKKEEVRDETASREKAATPPPTSPKAFRPTVVEKPTSSPDAWLGADFFAWAQYGRQQNGLIPEPEPRGLATWWSAALMTPGVDARVMMRAFAEFGQDEYWESKGYPFRAFMTEWHKYGRASAEVADGLEA